jgi:(p)ppGpp synthase/HD superfamily hydrolase
MRNLLDTAIKIATNAHSGQVDKGGEPYILHPLKLLIRFVPVLMAKIRFYMV